MTIWILVIGQNDHLVPLQMIYLAGKLYFDRLGRTSQGVFRSGPGLCCQHSRVHAVVSSVVEKHRQR